MYYMHCYFTECCDCYGYRYVLHWNYDLTLGIHCDLMLYLSLSFLAYQCTTKMVCV